MFSLRYCWTLKYLPSTSTCSRRFDVDHAMYCMKDEFVHRRHDDVRDLFASLLMDECHDLEVGGNCGGSDRYVADTVTVC